VLAVIFMMVFSAFVAVPGYNVSAEDHGDDENGNDECPFDEDDPNSPCGVDVCLNNPDSQECMDYIMDYCTDSDDPACDYFMGNGPDMVCYDSNNNEIVFSITSPEDCQGDGLMWVSTDDGPDGGDDDWNLENLYVHLKMESLSEWLVTLRGEFPVTESDMTREGVSEMCESMMGTNSGEISQECYDHWVMMMENDDHVGHNDCPPGLSEDECHEMSKCDEGSMNMSCLRLMYNYCSDNPNVCGDMEEDGPNFIFDIFDYEDGETTAEEFLASDGMQDFMEEMNMGDDDWNDAHDYGKYDLFTFNAANDGEVIIVTEFIYPDYNEPTFICGDGSEINFYYVNDEYLDCDDGADEQWYDNFTPDEYSDDCQVWNQSDCTGDPVNWFDCPADSTVWIYQVRDGNWDCYDGEDEGNSKPHTSWYGDVFLMEGYGSDIGDELTADDIMARSGNFCDWMDEDEVQLECMDAIIADLEGGSSYTLVTKGNAWTDYDSEDNETVMFGTGSYNHVMYDFERNHIMNLTGDVSDDSPMADFLDAKTTESGYGNFVMYHTKTFIVGSDGFTGHVISYGYTCNDYDDESYCYSVDGGMYVYDSFDETDTESGLIGSTMIHYYHNEEPECPDGVDSCTEGHMELELSPGDYTIVTTSSQFTSHGNSFEFTNYIVDENGSIMTNWSGELMSSYYDYQDGNQTVVEGDDRLHFPNLEHPAYNMEPKCYDEDTGEEISCDETFMAFAVIMGIAENMTAYEDGTQSASTAAENILELFYLMEELGFFDDMDDGENHDGVYWSSWNYCEWEGDTALPDGDMRWYCTDNDDGANGFDDWWYYCEAHDDGMNSTKYFCTDDFGQSSDYRNSASNEHYVEGGRPDNHHGDHNHNENGHESQGDEDDNPPLLDGIAGVQTSENNDDCLPSADTMIGMLSDNEGEPLICYQEMKFMFEGVDSSRDTHIAFIPFEDDDEWTLEVEILEGYEFVSCDGDCMVNSDGVMTGTGPTNVTFSKKAEEEPQPDCDYVIGLSADGMAFDPVKLSIKVGETVCWQWKDAAMAHNVLELEGEYDASMNLTSIDFGFSSGEPAMTVDYRHTFTEDNKIHYYVCEPHAQLGMVGQITVGNGTEDPVQQALEDNEVPSIGFVVGSLVLVGAAGLRRRIH